MGSAILLGFLVLNAIVRAGYTAGSDGPDRHDGPGDHGGFFFPPFFLLILIVIGLVCFFRGRRWSDGDRPIGSGGRHDWRTADSGGSGLGLAIARTLVEAHGGEIQAERAQGRARECGCLPCKPEAADWNEWDRLRLAWNPVGSFRLRSLGGWGPD